MSLRTHLLLALGGSALALLGYVVVAGGTAPGDLPLAAPAAAPAHAPTAPAEPGSAGEWAKAAGPMQFIPSTWSTWASDGDGDGITDVQDLDDAAYAAGRYLCASGDLATSSGWARGIFSYNHSQAYVDEVYGAARTYATRTTP